MTIRVAKLKDLPALTNLMDAFYKEGESIEPLITKLIPNPKKAFSAYLKESIVDKNSVIFVAEKNDNIIGFIRCVIKSTEPFFKIKKISKLTDFYVIPNLRGKGNGNLLLSKTFSWCKKKRAPNIFLGTLTKNPKSNKMYLDKGFIEFEREYWKNLVD